jgi:hypothetical protein
MSPTSNWYYCAKISFAPPPAEEYGSKFHWSGGVLESKDFGFQTLEFGLKQKEPDHIQIQIEIDNLQSAIQNPKSKYSNTPI